MTARNITLAVVINPVGAEKQAEALQAALRSHHIEVPWLETTQEDPGLGQAQQAVEQGADVVIACGGDGTVRACVEALAGTDTALAIVPAGTGNLLARNLGLPEDAAEAVEVALGRGRSEIDVGYVNGEAFAVMAGAGLDATIMRDTSRGAKERFGSLAYVKTALEHLRDPRVRAIVTVEDRPVLAAPVATVLAANHGRLQAGIDLFPDSDAHDGVLDVMAVRASDLGSWLKTAVAVVLRRDRTEHIERWRATQADVTFARPTPYELDGEARPPTGRLTFAIERQALTVCVPEETR